MPLLFYLPFVTAQLSEVTVKRKRDGMVANIKVEKGRTKSNQARAKV